MTDFTQQPVSDECFFCVLFPKNMTRGRIGHTKRTNTFGHLMRLALIRRKLCNNARLFFKCDFNSWLFISGASVKGFHIHTVFRCGFVLWLTPNMFLFFCYVSVRFPMVLWEHMLGFYPPWICVLYCIFKLFPWLNDLCHGRSLVVSVLATKQTDEPFKNVQLAFIMRPHHF